jgi:hypothetical protein
MSQPQINNNLFVQTSKKKKSRRRGRKEGSGKMDYDLI